MDQAFLSTSHTLPAGLNEPSATFDLDALGQVFGGMFAGATPRFFRAPGRVNLIGEHTDYNDGFVLPMAIAWGTVVAGAPRPDRTVVVYSLNRSDRDEFSLDTPAIGPKGHWGNYVRGVAYSLQAAGYELVGANLLIDSNLPVGAGLSSSAALENAVAYALLKLAEVKPIDRVKMALAGQAAEHQYVGTQCGIMDQFISALGQEDHALLIDCRSLTPTPISMHLPEVDIVICDSGVKHNLASSAYNQRRLECQRGVAALQQQIPGIQSLRDVSPAQFTQYAQDIPDIIVRQRVRHVITENERTLLAAAALSAGDTHRLGELMYASHASLRDDYQVSCPELDILVEAASRHPGVLGARMTGGGFGGCTVNLVDKATIADFKMQVAAAYGLQCGRTPRFFTSRAAQGVYELPL